MEYIDAQLLDHPSTVESFLEYPAEYPPQDGYLPEGSVRDYYPPYEDFASPTPSPYPVAPLMQPAFNFNSFDLHTPNVGPVASNCVEIFPPTPEPWLIPYPIFAAPPFPASYPVQTSAPKPPLSTPEVNKPFTRLQERKARHTPNRSKSLGRKQQQVQRCPSEELSETLSQLALASPDIPVFDIGMFVFAALRNAFSIPAPVLKSSSRSTPFFYTAKPTAIISRPYWVRIAAM